MGLRIFTTYEGYSETLNRLHRLIGEVEEAMGVVKENQEGTRYFPGDLDASIEEIQESVNVLKNMARIAKDNRRMARREADNG